MRRHHVGWPGERPGPVPVIDRGRDVHTIPPAEEILHRQDDVLGTAGKQQLQERVSRDVGERRCRRERLVDQHRARPGLRRRVRTRRPQVHEPRHGQHRVSFGLVGTIPPLGERIGVVRAARGDRDRRVREGVAKRCARLVPLAFPSQHAVTRQAQARQRLAHFVGHRSEILGNDAARRRSRTCSSRPRPAGSGHATRRA